MSGSAARHAIIAAGVVAIVSLMSSAALGFPLLPATAGLTSAASVDTMQVRWRGHGGGAGVAVGLMTGS